GPAGKGKEPLDGERDFAGAILAGLRLEARGEFGAAIIEVLGEKIEDLCAGMRRGCGPGQGRTGGFDGVADILAIALANFADLQAGIVKDRAIVAAVGANLLAANIQLGSLVDARGAEHVAGVYRARGGSRLERLFPGRLEIGGH